MVKGNDVEKVSHGDHRDERRLVVDDGQRSSDKLVLESTAIWDGDLVAVVGDDDDGSGESNALADVHISVNGQVVQLDNVQLGLEPLLELLNVLEVVTELDDRGTGELPLVAHCQLSVLEGVKTALDQQEIGTALYGQESGSGNVDTDGVLEVLDGGTDSGLELDDGFSAGSDLVVDNDLEVQLFVVEHTLDSATLHVQVVGVEDLESGNVLELVEVVLGNLSDLEQTKATLVVDQSTSLDIGLGLVGDLHDVLGLRVDHLLQDVEVDGGSQVVDVGDEDVLLSGSDELVEQSRVVQGVHDVSVTGRVETRVVRIGLLGDGQQGVLAHSRVLGLVEGEDVDVVVGVFLDDTVGIGGSVETRHQDERDVDVVGLVEVLDLPNTQVQEGQSIPDLDDRLGSLTSHGGSETSVQSQDDELVEDRRVDVLQLLVRENSVSGGSLDLVPVNGLVLGLFSQVSVEEDEEIFHLSAEDLLGLGVLDVIGHPVELISHGLGGNTSASLLEVNGGASTVPLGGIASGIRFEVVGHGKKSCVCVCVKKTV